MTDDTLLNDKLDRVIELLERIERRFAEKFPTIEKNPNTPPPLEEAQRYYEEMYASVTDANSVIRQQGNLRHRRKNIIRWIAGIFGILFEQIKKALTFPR